MYNQGRRQKNFQGREIERPKLRNSTNKPPSILSLAGYRVHWACSRIPRAHLKKTLQQKSRVKSEELFWRNIHFLENAYLFRKF